MREARIMLIAQISDTHLLEKGEAADWRLACLKRAVDTIAALSPAADLVIHTGDIAHNATAAEYALARAELQRLTMPVLATVGNRDRREAFLAAFSGRDLMPGGLALAQYGVVVDGVRMLAIDSLDDTRGFGTYPADRLADLAAAAGTAREPVSSGTVSAAGRPSPSTVASSLPLCWRAARRTWPACPVSTWSECFHVPRSAETTMRR